MGDGRAVDSYDPNARSLHESRVGRVGDDVAAAQEVTVFDKLAQ